MNPHTKTLLDGTQIKNDINMNIQLLVFMNLTQIIRISHNI